MIVNAAVYCGAYAQEMEYIQNPGFKISQSPYYSFTYTFNIRLPYH